MNLLNKILFLTATVLTVTSCSSDDALLPDNDNDNNTPLAFVAKLNVPETRATYDSKFDNNDKVRVMLDGQIQDFRANDTQLLPMVNLYWNNYDTIAGITASAWYPASPSYSYPIDQSSKAKLQSADFLFAETVKGIKRSNYKNLPLNFKHKTAKIGVVLKAGLDIKNDDLKNAEVKFYGYTKVATVDTASTSSKGVIVGNTEGWISPYKDNNGEFIALMLPVSFTGTNVIKVSINSVDYYYKGDVNFEGTKYYKFEITVNKTGLVIESSISDWMDAGKENGSAEME